MLVVSEKKIRLSNDVVFLTYGNTGSVVLKEHLLEISKIHLEKARTLADMEIKTKQKMLEEETKNEQNIFALEVQARKQELNL